MVGSTIPIIHGDNEIKTLMDKVKYNMDVIMNYANPGDHVPEIVRNNITFKERYCAQYHRPPFKNIPKVIIRYLAF